MDKQTVTGSGRKSGKGRSQAEEPAVGSEATEAVESPPGRPAAEVYQELASKLTTAEAAVELAKNELSDLAERCRAAGASTLTVDGVKLQIRKERQEKEEGIEPGPARFYFFVPQPKTPKQNIDASALCV